MYDLGYDGPVSMRPDLMLDALGVGELGRLAVMGGKYGLGALRSLLKSGSDDAMTTLAKAAEPQQMYRTVKKTGTGTAARKSSEAALKAQGERIANSKIQTQAQRAIQNASKEESQAILNLQGQLDKALASGVMEEQKAVKLFEEAVDNIFTQTRIDDMILKDGDQLAKQLGPTMQELYNTNKPLFNEIYNDLIQPLVSKKIGGVPNYRMNQFGGRVPKVIKNYNAYG